MCFVVIVLPSIAQAISQSITSQLGAVHSMMSGVLKFPTIGSD